MKTVAQVRLAAAAASAFTLAALITLLPFGGRSSTSLFSGFGMGVAALAWWLVFFKWKRNVER